MEARGVITVDTVKRIGPGLFVLLAVASLTLLGLIVLFSATHTQFSDPYTLLRKQIIWLFLALSAGAVTAFLDLEKLRRWVWLMVLGMTALLILVLVPGVGVSVNGARRWLDLGPMNMQVSDFVKIALIFVLAHYLALNQRHLHSFCRGFLIPCAIIGTVFLLVLLEPDFGTAFLLGLVGFTLLFLAGVPLMFWTPTVLAGAAFFALVVLLDPVRLRRITAFLDVEANKMDGTYQLWQGILAFGAGGVAGVGLGNGRQQISFLPEAHTDFIFPIIGEELGFFFTSGVVVLFLLIFSASLWNLRQAPNLFYFLLAGGALLLITVQALVNFGVVTGCLPTKGISLPFISYGGSNLVSMFILVGILINCFRRWSRTPLQNPRNL